MNQLKKSLSSLLLAAAMTAACTGIGFAADSSITYEGGAEKFVFLPGGDDTDTDLFDNFKNVMPGDSLEQKITIKNGYKGSDYVKIYMRAEVHDENGNPMSEKVAAEEEKVAQMNDFLSQLSMEISMGDKVIYQESPDQLDGLSENVLLGSFRRGVSADLIVKLNVPIEMGNEYANRVGEVDWVFTVEERNDPKDNGGGSSKPDRDNKVEKDELPDEIIVITPDEVPLSPGTLPEGSYAVLPKTGDDMNMWTYLALLAAGVAGIFLILLGTRRSKADT